VGGNNGINSYEGNNSLAKLIYELFDIIILLLGIYSSTSHK